MRQNYSKIMENCKTAIDVIKTRRSIRQFRPEIPARELLEEIVHCGFFAPTAWHREPWAIRVIQNVSQLGDLNRECVDFVRQNIPAAAHLVADENVNLLYHAPFLVVIAGDSQNPSATVDCSLAAENMLLAAWDLQLGSCIMGFISQFLNHSAGQKYAKLWQFPAHYKALIAFVLGFPAVIPENSPRDFSRVKFF